MHHKKKYRLKSKVKNILIYTIIFALIIIMNKNNILEPLYDLCKEKYLKTTYTLDANNIKNKVASSVFNNDENTDSLFMVKEKNEGLPLIYLYNTHQGEKYKPLVDGDFAPSIMTATSYLKEKLNGKNLNTIMETRNVSKVLNENNWKYGSSYKVTKSFMIDTLNRNNTIKYLFDIHRDSGSHSYTTLCVNDTCYAKILFLIGLENPNYSENQVFAEALSMKLNSKVKGISKGILQKEGKGVNGVYNEDVSNRVMLIEVGGENNKIDEVYRTMDVLSEVIDEFIREENI